MGISSKVSSRVLAIAIAACALSAVGSAEAQTKKGRPTGGKRKPAAAVVAPAPKPESEPAAEPPPPAQPATAIEAPTEGRVATTTLTSAQMTDAPGSANPAGATSTPAVTPRDAPAEPAPRVNESTGGEYRTLDGFRFITPIETYSAFANTSFRFAQGFGAISFQLPSPIDNTPTPGRLFLYGQQLFGQIGISNRVAIDLRAEGAAGVGGNLDSILGIGALAQLNVGGMPKVRLFTIEKPALQVSLGTGAFYTRDIRVQPAALIGKLAGELQGAEGQLIRQGGSFNLVPALMAAIALGPVGAQTSIAPSFGVAGDQKTNGLRAGVHLGFDIRRVTASVPVALVAEYGMTASFAQAGQPASTVNTVGGGVYYSGRRDFELGAVARVTPGDLSMVQGQMVMQYYF